jgi:septation ring formation regulator EzrA
MKQSDKSIYVAIIALIISILSLWLTFQNREYDRIVAFEQKKQEIRGLFMESELLSKMLELKIKELLLTEKRPEMRKTLSNWMVKVNEIRRETLIQKDRFDAIPATSNTDTRLIIEGMLTNMRHGIKILNTMIDSADKIPKE